MKKLVNLIWVVFVVTLSMIVGMLLVKYVSIKIMTNILVGVILLLLGILIGKEVTKK